MKVVIALAGEMLALGGVAETPEAGRAQAREAVADGSALDTFRRLVDAQDGDVSVVDDPDTRPDSESVATVDVPDGAVPASGGFVTDLDALDLGLAAVDTGAGRRTKEDDVDPTAGFSDLRKPGDAVHPGDVLARIHTQRTDRIEELTDAVREAYTFGTEAPEATPAVLGRYTRDGWDG